MKATKFSVCSREIETQDGALGPGLMRSSRLEIGIKRAVDVLLASLLLISLAPLLVMVAVAVKLQDGESIIYRRRVLGPDGEFDAYKFRSMQVDAERVLD